MKSTDTHKLTVLSTYTRTNVCRTPSPNPRSPLSSVFWVRIPLPGAEVAEVDEDDGGHIATYEDEEGDGSEEEAELPEWCVIVQVILTPCHSNRCIRGGLLSHPCAVQLHPI